jgi:aminopeptidase N
MFKTETAVPSPKTIFLKDYQKPDYFITSVNLNFDLREGVTIVTSELTLKREKAGATSIRLDGEEMMLKSVVIYGKEISSSDYDLDGESLTLHDLGEISSVTIINEIDPAKNTALEGLYVSNGMYCTQCEAEGFRRITYFLDRPDVMLKFKVRIEADKAAYPVLLSNGNNIQSGDLGGGRHFTIWDDPHAKPCYLFALVAGDLAVLEDHFTTMSGNDVTLRIFVEESDLDKCAHAMSSLISSMKWDEEEYGREYDLNIFNIVAVSHFNMGAMENKSLNIFNTKCVLAKAETATDADFGAVEAVVAHEYFHNWTGNRITCRDWFQLSLKEGLTVYRDHEFSADMGSRAVQRIGDVRILRQHQFAEDSGLMSHAVRPDSNIEINNFYTVTIYEKGSEVIRMYHTLLGAENFRKGTDLYFERHDGQAVTCDDFVAAMSDASGINLDHFKLWYSQAGTPVVTAFSHYDQKAQKFTLTLKQQVPDTAGQKDKQPMLIPVSFGLLGSDGEDLLGDNVILKLEKAEQSFSFDHITSKPVPSILRGFSAPVKLNNGLSFDELLFLLAHDSDHFNKWESGQVLATKIIMDLSDDFSNPKLDKTYIEAIRKITLSVDLDKAFIAELLTLPSEGILGQVKTPSNVDEIHQARAFVKKTLAFELKDEFLALYNDCLGDAPYEFKAEDAGKRKLKNTLLSYLMDVADGHILDLCKSQYSAADNMTDEIGALSALVNSGFKDKEDALDRFYKRWHADALVLDKWFSLQVSQNPNEIETAEDIIAKVVELSQHKDFDLKTPNRVRSLVSVFCGLNLKAFHDRSGKGYEFLTDIIIKLDPMNPQIAAGLVKPLTRWKSYDAQRQDLMKTALNKILKLDGLSKHVFEIASKSLK